MTSLVEHGRYNKDTAALRLGTVDRFTRFLAVGHGITDPQALTGELVLDFVRAVSAGGKRPADGTVRLRLFAVRAMSQEAVRLGLMDADPTLGIEPPPRAPLLTRPLTDAEIDRGRARAVASPSDMRHPIAWALSEATGRTSEIGLAGASDVDMDEARVWLPGTSEIDARWGYLTEWGLLQIGRRLRDVEGPDDSLIVWRSEPRALRAACSQAVLETLRAADLRAPDVRPRSIVAWAGHKALEDGMTLEQVARRLGMRSLDETAALLRYDWRGEGRS
jgi:integrase/recombinase XerC